MKRYALTAIGPDRPGIVAGVTKVLYEHGCNINDSSMTTIDEEFSIMLVMSAPESVDERSLADGLKDLEAKKGLTIHLKPLLKKAAPAAPHANYIISIHGPDRAGVIYKIAAALSESGIRIRDLETRKMDGENWYLMVMEVYSPDDSVIKKAREELKKISSELGVALKIKPAEEYEPI